MSRSLDRLAMLVQMAFRNLFASRLKTAIVGGIIFFGTVLVVVGGTLLDSVDQGMSRSIIGSAAGHIQVYSSASKDELSIFGGGMSEPDIAPMDDFSVLKKTLESVPNVKTVVPMGINGAMVNSGNSIDVALGRLREAVNKRRNGDDPPEGAATLDALKAHVRQMAVVLEGDVQNLGSLVEENAATAEARTDLARGASEEFWAGFDADPLGSLEFLENRIAPQATDADMLWLRYVGTDLDAFQKSFDRMAIVDGTPVPEGQRGFLFPKLFYEEHLKLKSARRLDRIREALTDGGKRIAGDAELERLVRENKNQVREILLQLDPQKAAVATARLQQALGSTETDLGKLLVGLFDTDDANFESRYQAFYSQVAPLLELYRIRIGDTLTIKAFTRSGYMQSVNIRVYGTFEFKGLEKAALSGSLSLMDLMSFRDLYGFLTSDRAREIADMKAASGAVAVDRESAEDALFGGGDTVVAEATPGLIDENSVLDGLGDRLRREEQTDRLYTRSELEGGVALSAAVLLHDPSKLEQTILDIDAAATRDGLKVKAVSWQKAAGMIGQMVMGMRLVLYISVLIIFIVALVIINNSMVMATLERTRELGTLRAIGAQRRLVLSMLLVEALVVGLVFGLAGAAVGAGFIGWLGKVGIPAGSDVMFFFFSGPRLFPLVSAANLIAAFVIVLVVSTLSGFYPAWLAMRVSPLQAMQSEE